MGTSARLAIADGSSTRHDFALRAGGLVSGRVTDAAGHPLAGVHAYLGPVWPYVDVVDAGIFTLLSLGFFDTGTLTRTDGTFTIRAVPPAPFLACFDATAHRVSGGAPGVLGYLATCSQATVVPRRRASVTTTDVALVAAAGGAIEGLVRDATGHGLRGATVALTPDGGRYPTAYAYSESGGRFRFAGLAPGSYRVCSAGEYAAGDRSRTGSARTCRSGISVSAGESTSTVLRLSPRWRAGRSHHRPVGTTGPQRVRVRQHPVQRLRLRRNRRPRAVPDHRWFLVR